MVKCIHRCYLIEYNNLLNQSIFASLSLGEIILTEMLNQTGRRHANFFPEWNSSKFVIVPILNNLHFFDKILFFKKKYDFDLV